MQKYYTYESLAEMLDVSKKTLYNAVSNKKSGFPIKPKYIAGIGKRFDGRQVHKYLNDIFRDN